MGGVGRMACQGFLVREACVGVLVGFCHVSLPAECFPVFSSCLGFCVWGGISVCWKFVVPLYSGGSSLGWGWMSGLSRFTG